MPQSEPDSGLCKECKYQRIVRNDRGSLFSLCNYSKVDPSYPKYPRLPVRECSAFDRAEPEPRSETSR